MRRIGALMVVVLLGFTTGCSVEAGETTAPSTTIPTGSFQGTYATLPEECRPLDVRPACNAISGLYYTVVLENFREPVGATVVTAVPGGHLRLEATSIDQASPRLGVWEFLTARMEMPNPGATREPDWTDRRPRYRVQRHPGQPTVIVTFTFEERPFDPATSPERSAGLADATHLPDTYIYTIIETVEPVGDW